MAMFNNWFSDRNGELDFYNRIKPHISTIFDVGCRCDSEFLDFEGEVHYFDPNSEFIDKLSKMPNKNAKAVFNKFGLGETNKELAYYPKYQSFFDRVHSCRASDAANKIILKIKKAKDYMNFNEIPNVDFLKIDTEGFEPNVLKGFEEKLENVNIVQFEYGGTFLDNGSTLMDVIVLLNNAGFHKFHYIVPKGFVPITDFSDHYQYCNIVCVNKKSKYDPFV
jgi:FkbM family methyltransferase